MRNPLRRDRDDLERRLRDERPVASDDLVRRLSGSTSVPARARQRFGLAVAVTAILVVAFALTGGIGYAASSASKGTQAVKQLVTGANTQSARSPKSEPSNGAAQSSSSARGSARRQYHDDIVVCHKPRRNGRGRTILVSSRELPRHLQHGDYLGPCRRNNNPT